VTEYLSIEQVLALHALQVERFGGARGLRDPSALASALARPQMTFGGDDLYLDPAAKAAALLHSLVQNHPFVDGIKRAGAHAALLFLAGNGFELAVEPGEWTQLVLAVARGELAAEAVAIWIRQRLRALAP